MVCYMCLNAYVDDELTCKNDFSSVGVGESCDDYRIFITTGWSKPTSIVFERYVEGYGWSSVLRYRPRYCPNCGRELFENKGCFELKKGRDGYFYS